MGWKDNQIEEIRKQIEEITKTRRTASQKTNKKAVRIKEPDEEFEELQPDDEELINEDTNETTNEITNETSAIESLSAKKEAELYESYL